MTNRKLHIGIVGPVNPYDLREFLEDSSIASSNNAATSITTYVKELCLSGYSVSVFMFQSSKKNIEYHGSKLHIYAVSSAGIIPGTGLLFRMKRLHRMINKHINEVDLLHAQWTYEYAYVAQKFTRQKKVFCSVRDWCPFIRASMKSWSDKLYWNFLYLLFKVVMNNDEIVFFANSDYTFSCIKEAYPDKKVYFVPNPICKEYIIRKKVKSAHSSHPIFISIAQTVSNVIKNNIKTVKAFELFVSVHPNAELWFVGVSHVNGEVERYVSEHKVRNVTFLGSVPHDKLFDYIDQASCLVHASIKETFGNILLEAMARKVPCIGGDKSGGVPQVLEDGICGLLCDVYDEKSIFEAMEKTLNIAYVNEIVDNATEKLLTQYSSDINMQTVMNLYMKVL